MLTLERLKELLSYDPDTGIWTWRVARSNCHPGDVVASKTTAGYIQVMIDRKNYTGHRLAWFYMTGEWPIRKIDHKDCDRSNNRWENLRLADDTENRRNVKRSRNNTTGFKGVSRIRSKFKAVIWKNYKPIHLGHFSTAEEAHQAYAKAAAELFGEFARAA